MPIVVTCTNCDKKLRVPDELLGKKVKCPGCGTIFLGKVADSADDEDKPPTSVRSKRATPKEDRDDDEEQSENPSGGVQSKPSQKGSRPKDDDEDEPPERPSRAGKKNKDDDDEDEVPSKRRGRKEDDDDDRPSKRRGRKDDDDDDDRPSRRRRFADDEDDDDDDDDRPSRRRLSRRNLPGHHGVVVLILGIGSIVAPLFACCILGAAVGGVVGLALGIPAWIVGHMDRQKMAAGRMDPSGHGLVTAGWICAIIGASLGAAYLFCGILALIGLISAGAFNPRNGF